MLVTILEAEVAPEQSSALRSAFDQAGDQLPPAIRETFLMHVEGSDVWRIATVWNSREELEDYRRSVKTPGGIIMFRSAGAEPTLTIHDVAGHRAR